MEIQIKKSDVIKFLYNRLADAINTDITIVIVDDVMPQPQAQFDGNPEFWRHSEFWRRLIKGYDIRDATDKIAMIKLLRQNTTPTFSLVKAKTFVELVMGNKSIEELHEYFTK